MWGERCFGKSTVQEFSSTSKHNFKHRKLNQVSRSYKLRFQCVQCQYTYLHTSLPLENMEERMTSGAIQAYVPAALILVVLCHSLAKPKSVIFKFLLFRSPFSTFSSINTGTQGGKRLMFSEHTIYTQCFLRKKKSQFLDLVHKCRVGWGEEVTEALLLHMSH